MGNFVIEHKESEPETAEFEGYARGVKEALGIVASQPPTGDYRIVKSFTVNLTTPHTESSRFAIFFAIFMNNSKVYEEPPYESSTTSEVNVTVAAITDGGVEYLYAWIN